MLAGTPVKSQKQLQGLSPSVEAKPALPVINVLKPPNIPPLKLGLPMQLGSPDARPYEVSGIAKPMSPMLRHAGSSPESFLQRQLPRLSRTGWQKVSFMTASTKSTHLEQLEANPAFHNTRNRPEAMRLIKGQGHHIQLSPSWLVGSDASHKTAGGLTPRSPGGSARLTSARLGSPRVPQDTAPASLSERPSHLSHMMSAPPDFDPRSLAAVNTASALQQREAPAKVLNMPQAGTHHPLKIVLAPGIQVVA